MSDSNTSPNGAPSGNTQPSGELREALLSFRCNMQLLRSSLILGDLEVASRSFAALRDLAPQAPTGVSMSAKAVSTGAKAFVALHTALDEGDLTGARRAFLKLISSMRAHPPSRPRHQPPTDDGAQDAWFLRGGQPAFYLAGFRCRS